MSGTAALAAARRRRAGGAAPSAPSTVQGVPKQDTPKIVLNPTDVLKHHDRQINVLTKDIADMKAQTSPVTSDDIDFYKQKYTSLLGEITEIRTSMVKTQTFYMELNMKVDKLIKDTS